MNVLLPRIRVDNGKNGLRFTNSYAAGTIRFWPRNSKTRYAVRQYQANAPKLWSPKRSVNLFDSKPYLPLRKRITYSIYMSAFRKTTHHHRLSCNTSDSEWLGRCGPERCCVQHTTLSTEKINVFSIRRPSGTFQYLF